MEKLLAELERFPATEKLPLSHDSLGSPYVAFRTAREMVCQLSKQSIVDTFRCVFLDPQRGMVQLMSPSGEHEELSRGVDAIVEYIASVLEIPNYPFGSTRWRRQNDPDGTGAEPDACYYLGNNVINYFNCKTAEERQIYLDTHEPDLVVEVTITHMNREKVDVYRELGVPEYWQVMGSESGTPDVTFYDLQTNGATNKVAESLGIPGLTPVAMTECLRLRRQPFQMQRNNAIRNVLLDHGVITAPADEA